MLVLDLCFFTGEFVTFYHGMHHHPSPALGRNMLDAFFVQASNKQLQVVSGSIYICTVDGSEILHHLRWLKPHK